MPAMTLNAIAQSSAERLVNSAVEGVVLALLAWLVLRLVPRQNAGTRFLVWMAALLSIAALPLVEVIQRQSGPVASAISHPALTLPAGLGLVLFLTWVSVAMLLLARVVMGLIQLRKLRASAEAVDPAMLDVLPRQTLLDFQQHRAVELCVSDAVSVPTAVGLFRPAVLVPRWTLSELSADDLNSVLVHELAHLKRRDDWTNLLQKVVRAVFFFHPAVWWIENRLSLEREMACDEHVLATQANPRAYAECLVSLAERGFLHRAVAMAQGAVSRVRECSARVAQILNASGPGSAKASRLALVSAASGSVLMLATFAQAPNLVVFGSYSTPTQMASAEVSDRAAQIVPASWHPQNEAVARATTSAYAPKVAMSVERKAEKPALVAATRKAVVQPGKVKPPSAPGLYHTVVDSNTESGLYHAVAHRSAAPTNDAVGTVVLIQETAFYTNGQRVWQISIYRMAVLQEQPTAPHDFSRKAI